MSRLFLIILGLCVLISAGCTKEEVRRQLFEPYTLDTTPPPGPPEYRQGFSDGCESGIAAYSNSFVKTFQVYKLKQDPKLVGNRVYYQIWKDAFLYCSVYYEAQNKWLL